ncbi:aspartic proteinase CDR1-like [Ananas comosus]|uniref:Aspartic proteinase CDR1-like n=2 Tax=Ananas comosus TaxID=4615 RepID=A0A6P5GIT8_ANACO|nr:aspartic proteinase CDR1-like [Ananas comosus]CAD1833340.1 unnamed protein product [Ananas comosus var. bracteatus]
MSPLNLLIYFSLLLHSSYAQPTGEKGLSLELIHIDSKRSPFYDANLTDFQRIVRSIDYSKSRVLWLESMMIARANPTAIRPPLHAMPPAIFMVAIGIGSGHGLRNYYLHIDTGSSLTWTQCLPCSTCFHQSAPMFDPRLSPTYRVVDCDDPLCKPPLYKCVNDRCEYHIEYYDNTFIDGVVSRETFTFQDAHSSHSEEVRNLVFGCTHSSHMNYHGNPAGIFSMSLNPTSTVRQLAALTHGLFSYCLFPPAEAAHASFLRFGHDIKTPRGGIHSTRIFEYDGRVGFYYLDLKDISLNGWRMNFPRSTFARHSDGTGGFVVDSGTAATQLTTHAFDRVEYVMKDYFRRRLNLHPVNDSSLPFRLCYKIVEGIERRLPTMALHFRDGADYHIRQSSLFTNLAERQTLCFSMLPGNDISILGAKQQFNTWMRFDTIHNKLAFAPHDCVRDAAN